MNATLSKPALKRLHKELLDLKRSDTGGLILEPDESNMTRWKGWIPGPSGSPYEGGVWEVGMVVPGDYPFKPPTCTFTTPIYHCNVNAQGQICLDILKGQWSPALSLHKVLLSISSLMSEPNEKDPLVGQIANLYKTNRLRHDVEARNHTMQYAMKTRMPNGMKRPSSAIASSTPFTLASGSGSGSSTNAIDLSGNGGSRSTTSTSTLASSSSSHRNLSVNGGSGSIGSRPIAGNGRVASSSSSVSTARSSSGGGNSGQAGQGQGQGQSTPRVSVIDLLDDDADGDAHGNGSGDAQSGRRVKRKVNAAGTSVEASGSAGVSASGSGGRTNGRNGGGNHEAIEID